MSEESGTKSNLEESERGEGIFAYEFQREATPPQKEPGPRSQRSIQAPRTKKKGQKEEKVALRPSPTNQNYQPLSWSDSGSDATLGFDLGLAFEFKVAIPLDVLASR